MFRRRKLQAKNHRSDAGFTLVEIIFAMVITAFIAVVILKTTENASASLTRTADEVNSNLEVMNFSHNIRFDIAGSYDVFAFGTAAPSSSTLYSTATAGTPTSYNVECSSYWDSGSNSWELDSTSQVVRSLFTIKEKYFTPLPSDAETSNFYEPANTVWYGYEIRRAAVQNNQPLPKYQLWRVECPDGGPNVGARAHSTNQDKLLMNLGISLNGYNSNGSGNASTLPIPSPTLVNSPISGGSGITSSQTACSPASNCANVLLHCITESGNEVACPVNESSASYAYYRF